MSVSISVFSDLHLEFGDIDLSHINSDVVVLAGDIFIKNRGAEWIKKQFGMRDAMDVIVIDGNHEFYGSNIDSIKRKTREALADIKNVHYLDDQYVDLHGIRFIGSTLWTDFNLLGNPTASKNMAAVMINDYKKIRIPAKGNYRRLHPNDTVRMHLQSRTFIANTIQSSPLPTVVITHHAPSMRSVLPKYRNNLLSAAFASNMEQFILDHPSKLWLYGHTHTNEDHFIGTTRVIANQRGCVGSDINPHFNPNHQIILDI